MAFDDRTISRALVPNAGAPPPLDVHADGAAVISTSPDTVTVVLTAVLWDEAMAPPALEPEHMVVGRLTLPLAAACGLARRLNDFLRREEHPITRLQQDTQLQ